MRKKKGARGEIQIARFLTAMGDEKRREKKKKETDGGVKEGHLLQKNLVGKPNKRKKEKKKKKRGATGKTMGEMPTEHSGCLGFWGVGGIRRRKKRLNEIGGNWWEV